jgi:DNA-binding beta-propeller fold protein YncE
VSPPLTPAGTSDLFLVSNLSGDVAGFADTSGRLAPVSGSAVRFAFPLVAFAADAKGNLLAGISGSPLGGASLQAATIGPGGKLTANMATTSVVTAESVAVSTQGVIAVTDTTDAAVKLFTLQNGQFVAGASASTGPLPQDATFSADGKFLYVADNANGTISVFSVSSATSLQLAQTAQMPVAPGEFSPSLVRVRLSAAENKIAASTPDGRIFVADLNGSTHLIANATEIHVAANANLEEIGFDPNGQSLYALDQDNGGIYEFSLAGGTPQPLTGSPLPTPPGISGMAVNSAGNRVYVVVGSLSTVVTFARDVQTGALSSTNESVASGGLLAGRIVRVAGH